MSTPPFIQATVATPVAQAGTRSRWRTYLELTKPRVVALMIFTVIVGMLLATRGAVPWRVVLFAPLGIALVAASAAAINHLVDRRIDAAMARTRGRPLPRGALDGAQVAAFAEWGAPSPSGKGDLRRLTQPVLVVSGSNDLVHYTVNAYALQRGLPQAQLIIYPDSGHGGIFQFHQQFVDTALEFLERQ